MSKCRSCGAEIVWAETIARHTKIPLDATPERRFVLVDVGEPDRVAQSVPTYVSHFATCPNAAEHRKS